jgi:hypothetical protein
LGDALELVQAPATKEETARTGDGIGFTWRRPWAVIANQEAAEGNELR